MAAPQAIIQSISDEVYLYFNHFAIDALYNQWPHVSTCGGTRLEQLPPFFSASSSLPVIKRDWRQLFTGCRNFVASNLHSPLFFFNTWPWSSLELYVLLMAFVYNNNNNNNNCDPRTTYNSVSSSASVGGNSAWQSLLRDRDISALGLCGHWDGQLNKACSCY